MKMIAVLATALAVAAPSSVLAFERITTEADYRAKVVGKTYCNDRGCWRARKNGKMTGKFGDLKFDAVWEWRKGFACRQGKLGKQAFPVDCQVIEVSGKKLRVTRNQGKGKKVVYSRK